jgi:hypothetical protein
MKRDKLDFPIYVKVASVYYEILVVAQCGTAIILESKEKTRIGMLYGFVNFSDSYHYTIIEKP